MSVLLTDGEQRSTLAVVRSLGRAGVKVVVGAESTLSLASSSRYCATRLCYPSPLDDPEAFLECITNEVRSGDNSVLIPMTEITTLVIAEAAQRFGADVVLPIPKQEQISTAQDKRRVCLLARHLGINVPSTFMLSEDDRVEDLASKLPYPVVIKPRFSRLFHNGTWAVGSVDYAVSPKDLIAKYHAAHSRIPYPLVQERIEGEGRGVFLCIWGGELKAALCHRRLREKPPWGGVSVYSESIPLDQKLVEKSFELLRAIGWQGVAMVEYKVDGRDGRAKLMEINGRFWGSLQLAIDAGVDFPLILYRLASGEKVSPQFSYQVGTKFRWLLGDLDNLSIRLRRAWPLGYPRPSASRIRACCEFLKFYEINLHYDVARFGDLRPAWFELKAYMRTLLLQIRALFRRHQEVETERLPEEEVGLDSSL